MVPPTPRGQGEIIPWAQDRQNGSPKRIATGLRAGICPGRPTLTGRSCEPWTSSMKSAGRPIAAAVSRGRSLLSWQDFPATDFPPSVNLSARHVGSGDVCGLFGKLAMLVPSLAFGALVGRARTLAPLPWSRPLSEGFLSGGRSSPLWPRSRGRTTCTRRPKHRVDTGCVCFGHRHAAQGLFSSPFLPPLRLAGLAPDAHPTAAEEASGSKLQRATWPKGLVTRGQQRLRA